jgi:hypothetical protein
MNDAHPVVNLIRTVKLVTYVNYGTKIIPNIKHNNAAEAVIEAEAARGQTLCHCTVNSRAGLVQTRRQVLEFGPAHVSVIPEDKRSTFATEAQTIKRSNNL